jgi:uncharacterized protein (TIGR02996 family)
MRTFQFSDAKSHKFWTIDVSGASFTVTYGKIGTAGQTQTKTFPTAEKARAEAEKLVREKTGKGYVETTPTATVSDAEALERGVMADPDDVAGWSAYADYLIERGDPRGEFMRVQLALEDEALSPAERKKLAADEKKLLAKHSADWLGPLAPFLLNQKPEERKYRPETIRYQFRRGWLAELEIPDLTVEFVRAMIRCPEARMLQRLHIHSAAYEFAEGDPRASQYADGKYKPGPDIPEGVDSWDVSLHLLARFPHLSAVRVFHLGNPLTEAFDESDQCHTPGKAAYHCLKQMPNVEEVYLLAHDVDAAKIFALPMPLLRVLQYDHGRMYPLDKLAANKTLTNLTTLRCHPHALEYDDEDPGAYIRFNHLRAICRSPHLPRLTHLRLRLSDFGDRGAREIVDSGILKRLKVLDLQGGCITDEGAEALAGCPDLKNLEFLNLNTNAMSSHGEQILVATGVKVNTAAQHSDVPPFGDDELPEYLFEGDIE